METTEIKQFIIKRLGSHYRHDDIIKAVCEKTGMQWNEAQQFVQRVQTEHSGEIAGRQNVLVILIASITTLVGLALSIGILIATFSGWIIFFLSLPIPYLGNLLYFGGGVAMIIGGIRGFMNAFSHKPT